MDKQEEATTNEYIRNRLLKAEKLRERGIEPYPYAFDQKDHAAAITEAYQKLKEGEETNKIVSVYAATNNQPMLIPKPKRPTRAELEAEIVRLSKVVDMWIEKSSVAYMRGYSDAMGRECMPEDIV